MNDKPDLSEPDHQPAPETGEEARNTPQGDAAAGPRRDIWPQFRRLLIFQIKLYIDALRDLILSPLSVVVFLLDIVQGNRGDKALFESLLQFGRKTEQAINLFNQHDIDDENFRGIDSLLAQAEDLVRKEYTDGSVSASARDSIGKSLERLRKKLKDSEQSG